jgi:peptidoglycan-associated lipoprotein
MIRTPVHHLAFMFLISQRHKEGTLLKDTQIYNSVGMRYWILLGQTVALLLVGILVLGGCSSASKTAEPDMQPSQIASSGTGPNVIELSDSRLQDALREGDIPPEDRDELPWLPQRAPLGMNFSETRELQTIYFEFDKYSLTAQTREALQRNAEWLKQHAEVVVQIEGHCDERGTLEYNQVLGENRAVSTKKYLVSLGVNPDRIYTISYGETQPADPGHDEDAWAKNRRAVFKIGQ